MSSPRPPEPTRPMPRYLTPSTIGLLALISVYTDGVVPSAAMIPVLSFLVSHLRPLSVKDENVDNYTVTTDNFQKVTISLASSIPGRTIWDLLLKKLWEIDSFDALNSFFDTLVEDENENPKPIVLSRRSLLGRFVARAQLEFKILVFESGVRLWKSFINYRAPTLSLWNRRHPTAGKHSFDINIQDVGMSLDDRLMDIVYGDITDSQNEGTVATHDIVKLLEYQITRMQKMGIRVSQSMKDQMRNMTSTGALTVPHKTYLLGCLDAWKSGDYSSALDSLHRYFDYATRSRDHTYFQNALLNLTILQADFGCHSEAVEVIKETIQVARRNNDVRCLNFCLSWLYHFGKGHPTEMSEVLQEKGIPSDKKTLAILKSTARATKMWGLLCTSLLSEAKSIVGGGGSVLRAFKCVLKASHLNVTKNMPQCVGSQMMMQCTLYNRLGVTCQSTLYLDIFLKCYASKSHVADGVQFACKSALTLARRGHYDEALAYMDGVDELSLRTLKSYHIWTAALGILKMQRFLHRDNLVAAERILSKIHDIPFLGLDMFFTLEMLKIDLHMRRKDYSEALAILEKFATKLQDEKSDISHRISVMVLKARIFDKAGTPQKGFSVAVRAARIARRAFNLRGLWEAISALARVLISIKEFDAAAKLLEVIMPPLLEYDDCHLTGRSFCFLADAHMGMAGEAETGSLQRKERLTKGLECIDRSFDEFSRIEDVHGQCETMAKKATIMYLNGDLVLANDCAAKYLDIKRAAKEKI